MSDDNKTVLIKLLDSIYVDKDDWNDFFFDHINSYDLDNISYTDLSQESKNLIMQHLRRCLQIESNMRKLSIDTILERFPETNINELNKIPSRVLDDISNKILNNKL